MTPAMTPLPSAKARPEPVLATRLTENPSHRVPPLEAGHGYPAEVDAGSLLGAMTRHDWGHASEPGPVSHPGATFRGKVLGGSPAVNGSVPVRALPSDSAHGWCAEQKDCAAWWTLRSSPPCPRPPRPHRDRRRRAHRSSDLT